MKPIFLIGYMGSGKTTLGKALSNRLGIQFIDLDIYIEGRFMQTVRQLFIERGEEGFRKIERNMLHEIAEIDNVIIACGGGTPCYSDNMEYMNRKGQTIFLQTSLQRLYTRLARNREKRPLIMHLNDHELYEFIAKNITDRLPYYSKAQHIFCGEELEDRKQISKSVDKFINTFLTNNP